MIKRFTTKPWLLPLVLLLCWGTQQALAQTDPKARRTITGIVTDSDTNNAIPGASVSIKNTARGVITDYDGKYLIEAESTDVLVFSFMGMEPQETEVGARTTIDVVLQYDTKLLADVVVVGYGVSKKSDLTGSVASVSSEKLNQGAITNPLQQITGKMAGVSVTQTGSEPGANPSVRVRGVTSLIGGNDPLVVVDGVQGNMDLLNQVAPSEIETIDVLKDASATAIYGSRGAPGVIIVTTKRSKTGKVSVEYSGTSSVDQLANKLDVFDAAQWREQAKLWGVPVATDHGSDTDWYSLLTKTGFTHNHSVAVGGSAEKFNYRASFAAILQDGLVLNSRHDAYNARIQATQKALDDKLTLSVNLNNSIRKNQGSPNSVGRAAFTSNLISNAYVSKPTDPVLFEDGSYFFDENIFQYINPYAVAQTVVNESEVHSQFANLRADLELIDGLRIGWFGSWRKVDQTAGYYAPAKSTLDWARANNGVANVSTNLTDERLMDFSLQYDLDLGRNKLNATAVYEWQQQSYQGHFAQAKGFINDLAAYHALQLGSVSRFLPGDMSSYKNDRRLVSFLGRVNYSFDQKYLLTLSMRRDGSSVFGRDHKWGNFPSVSVAWRVSEEAFLKDNDLLSNLKIRAGYGITGNQQGLYPQQSMQLVGASGTTFFNGGLITNFGVTQNANKDLSWETRYQTNIGLEMGFFQNRLNATVEVFTATTRNLLFNYTVPQPPYPFGSMVANVGSLLNEGLEFTLDYTVYDANELSIQLAANVSLLRNEVLELSGAVNGIELKTDYVGWGQDAFLIKGQPIGSFYILKNNGKDDVNSELVHDLNADGQIDQGARSQDRYLAGGSLPTYTYAFSPTVRYKKFDLAMVFRGAGGNKIYNKIRKDFSMFENLGKSNLLASSTSLGLFTSKYSSDLWLERGDFLRIENISLGYNLTNPVPWVEHLRVSLTANNLSTFTAYTGLDPELIGTDGGIYPRTRSFALGLNLTF